MYNAMVKTRNKKGFTLMEMLIVVAIIAILVAVSVPVFTSQLNNAKTQTDAANERAAKAVAVATYLTDGTTGTFFYDASDGVLRTANTVALMGADAGYGKTTTNSDKVIQIVISTDGSTTISWVAEATT